MWRKIERERREAKRAKEENEAKTASEGSTAEEPAAETPEPAVAATSEPAAPEPQGQSEQPDQIITQAVPQAADDVQTGSVAKVQDQIVTQPSTAATEAPAAAEAPAQPAWQHTQIESPKVPEQTAAVTPAPAPAPSASEEPAPAAPSGPALSILQTEPTQPQTDAVKPRTKPEASTTAGTSPTESAPQPAPTELVLKNVPLPRPKPARPGRQTGEAENSRGERCDPGRRHPGPGACTDTGRTCAGGQADGKSQVGWFQVKTVHPPARRGGEVVKSSGFV